MIVDSPLDLGVNDLFLRLAGFRGLCDVFLKLEGLNVAGSIKIKPARAMIEDLERRRLISRGTHRIIESSSGSLGVALSFVCRVKGYRFTCVTDPNIAPTSKRLMEAYGSEVVVVTEPDEHGGYLGTRLAYIADRLRRDDRYFWPNQYANDANPRAHYRWTAREIHEQFAAPDFVFIGAGTTGTLVGCAHYFAVHSPTTRVVAVDTVGSVTFGHRGGPRHLPGLGTSRRPDIASMHNVSDVVMVPEWQTVDMCHAVLRRYGFLVGGSTGTVLAAIDAYRQHLGRSSVVVAIAPDLGDRYLTTIYDQGWVGDLFRSTHPHPGHGRHRSGAGSHRPVPVGVGGVGLGALGGS